MHVWGSSSGQNLYVSRGEEVPCLSGEAGEATGRGAGLGGGREKKLKKTGLSVFVQIPCMAQVID